MKLIVPALLLFAAPAIASELPLPAKIEFNRDVRPILSETCFKCHGFDKKHREGKRRLDTREGALAENEGVRAIVPGKLDESEFHVRIHSTDKDEQMPPPDSGKKIDARQIAILDKWIEQGAEYQPHWAYAPLARPAAPAISDFRSQISDWNARDGRGDWTQNPIDRLVASRLSELGLKPSREAEPQQLIRRISFDLTGLPPTSQEVDDFAAHVSHSSHPSHETDGKNATDASDAAYARLVDRLLAFPEFGERMAVSWLDVVRYADTIGFHSDNPRNVWPYRDYVIRAFNENEPFDKFTVEQLAGDLLPNATLEQRVASAFNRLNLTTEEGGAQAKDYEARTVADRVRAIGTVWLAQTTGCCQCHDHKYDPITTRDFYRLGAFFTDIKESAIGRREEGMLVPTPEQMAKLKEFDTQLAELQNQLSAPSAELDAAQAAWETENADGPKDGAWTPLHAEKVHADRGSKLEVRDDESIEVAVEGNAASDSYFVTVKTPPGQTTGFKLEALASDALPAKGPGRASNGNFVLNEFTVKEDAATLKIAEATATFEQQGLSVKLAIDGKSEEKKGWGVLGNIGRDAAAYFQLEKPIDGEKTITFQLRQIYGDHHTLGKFRLLATAAPKPIRAPNALFPADVIAALKLAPEQRTPEQRAKIAKQFRSVAPQLAGLRQKIADAQAARANFEKTVPRCLVSESMQTPRTVRILPRGNWQDESGEIVEPGVPEFLPQPANADKHRLSRLDLAQWIVSKENPLPARVFLNRLWKLYFGIGLSKVLDDVGAQGEPPVNPALLDWLAAEFVESGWDVKHMVRLIVTSATYRQSSLASKELQQRDPYNRELARQSRFRLDAEFVRDNALAISGLLVRKVGGPSVKPYQPAGYWENLNFPTREWQQDNDANQWRRGLYTWWQRSYLHPSLAAFDAPSREECAAERVRSNIPQQALVLL
ncbi:MAG TPA: PSD1 and planctomycete cytochrome C domain-containing protein, partial [Chthoniobacteraceae bacterium]|nr:PSD1 and planctomycete cytochrome C domain-containing protein [Chthoniobacteraceae bacterium]